MARLIASAAARLPMAEMYPLSSVISRTFTLISSRPILLISWPTFSLISFMNFSRSLLISSIVRVAITRRSWPRMMSWASSRIWPELRGSRRSAALFMRTASVDMPTVNVAGTLTRMLFSDSAPSSGMSMTRGSRFRYE